MSPHQAAAAAPTATPHARHGGMKVWHRRRSSVPRESELIRSFQSQPKPAREHFFKCDETTRSHGIECARYGVIGNNFKLTAARAI